MNKKEISAYFKKQQKKSLKVRNKKYGNFGAYMRKKGKENAKKKEKEAVDNPLLR